MIELAIISFIGYIVMEVIYRIKNRKKPVVESDDYMECATREIK